MTPKVRPLLQLCIEVGIMSGYARAHKHEDNPSGRTVQEAIEAAIWQQIDEAFDFTQTQENDA